MFNNLKHTKNMYNNNNDFRGNGQNGQPRSVNNNQGNNPTVNNNNMCAACDSKPGVFKGAWQSAKDNPGKTAAIVGAGLGVLTIGGFMVKNVKNNGFNPMNWTLTGGKKTKKAAGAEETAQVAEEGKK